MGITADQFEQWQLNNISEQEVEEIILDMMSMEEDLTSKVVYSDEDGLGITENGDVVYTNRDEVRFQKALKKQQKKAHQKTKFTLIK